MSRKMSNDDPRSMNYGQTRTWMYLSKVSVPIFGYIVFPLIIITYKGKIYNAAKKELLESQFVNSNWFLKPNDQPHIVIH